MKTTGKKSVQLLYNLSSSDWLTFLGHSVNRRKFTTSIKREIVEQDHNQFSLSLFVHTANP